MALDYFLDAIPYVGSMLMAFWGGREYQESKSKAKIAAEITRVTQYTSKEIRQKNADHESNLRDTEEAISAVRLERDDAVARAKNFECISHCRMKIFKREGENSPELIRAAYMLSDDAESFGADVPPFVSRIVRQAIYPLFNIPTPNLDFARLNSDRDAFGDEPIAAIVFCACTVVARSLGAAPVYEIGYAQLVQAYFGETLGVDYINFVNRAVSMELELLAVSRNPH